MNEEGNPVLEKMRKCLAVARGEQPADLLFMNGRLINVFSSEVCESNLAVKDGLIAAIGAEYKEGETVIDLKGQYLAPGLIDAHLHVESTLLLPPELARVLVPRGTTCVVSDPHEIANVLGFSGVEMMLSAAEGLACDYFYTVPSCVPATAMETSGAEVNAEQVARLLEHPRMVGLGEVMNYPGVLDGDPEMLSKIAAAHKAGKVADGHAPALRGADLQAYLSTGITTDHETITSDEAGEKLQSGMKIIIRHGSASSSLEELLPLVNDKTINSFMFGSDDREAGELLTKGHLDDLLKTAVALGGDPVQMLKIATINAARHYRLYRRGALAPGYRADLVIFEDLRSFKVNRVVKNGLEVVRDGLLSVPIPHFKPPRSALKSINIGRKLSGNDFSLRLPGGRAVVIGVIPGQLTTEKLLLEVPRDDDGLVKADPANGINKIAVAERHKASGRLAVGLVQGIGLKQGAVASSVAHDSHNILVAGVEETAMAAAVNELAEVGGGFIVVNRNGRVMACLPLPVAGLMSPEPAEFVSAGMEKLLAAVKTIGSTLTQPFLTLSFLALPVIPSLKITDRGLFDVDNFKFL